jgi:hypothetical protein
LQEAIRAANDSQGIISANLEGKGANQKWKNASDEVSGQ